MKRIFLIEDDEAIARQIQQHFQHWDLQTTIANDFQQIMKEVRSVDPALVIIDIQLPAYDGFHWCREIRAESKIPIIFLSSRDQPMDSIMAMQLGADDYVQKPFHMDVLLSKIQALLRRTYEYTQVEKETVHQWNGIHVNIGLKFPKNAGLKFLTSTLLQLKAEGTPQPSFSPPYDMNRL